MLPVLGAKTAEEVLDRSSLWAIGLVVALLILAWAAYRLLSWFGEDEDRTDGDQELLTHLRHLRSDGDVSEEEYRSIKGRLTERMKSSSTPDAE